jgi:hypothetical protein
MLLLQLLKSRQKNWFGKGLSKPTMNWILDEVEVLEFQASSSLSPSDEADPLDA